MDIGLVCDSCSTFNPMGAPHCQRCNASLSLDSPSDVTPASPATRPSAEPATAKPPATAQHAAGRTCPSCDAVVNEGHRFCGACGHHMDEPVAQILPAEPTRPKAQAGSTKHTMFFGAMQAARAKLVLIKGDGLDGVSFTLAGDQHIAGREDAPLLFEEDPFLSPTHANFFYRDNKLVVRDEGSVNGVYIRIRGTTEIGFGARFLVGEQLLEVEATSSGENSDPDADGTYLYTSPVRPSHFRVTQQLRGGNSGLAYRAQSEIVSLGREGNDINFPDDPFISGHHAQVAFADGKLTLSDLTSKNGTFLRIDQEQQLNHGDYVFMGQQLLRVEIV